MGIIRQVSVIPSGDAAQHADEEQLAPQVRQGGCEQGKVRACDGDDFKGAEQAGEGTQGKQQADPHSQGGMETGPGGDGNRRAAQGERQEKKDCQPGKEQAEMTGKALEERNAFRCGEEGDPSKNRRRK